MRHLAIRPSAGHARLLRRHLPGTRHPGPGHRPRTARMPAGRDLDVRYADGCSAEAPFLDHRRHHNRVVSGASQFAVPCGSNSGRVSRGRRSTRSWNCPVAKTPISTHRRLLRQGIGRCAGAAGLSPGGHDDDERRQPSQVEQASADADRKKAGSLVADPPAGTAGRRYHNGRNQVHHGQADDGNRAAGRFTMGSARQTRRHRIQGQSQG